MKTKFIQALAALASPIIFILILLLFNVVPMPFQIDLYGFGGTLFLCIAVGINFIMLKKDKKTYKNIGFVFEKKTPLRFLMGLLIGIIVTVCILFVVVQFSSVDLSYNVGANVWFVLLGLLAFFPLAFMEEIIFRGQAFIKMNETFGLWPAQIVLALLFTWYHDFTGITFFNQLLGPGIWAFVFGVSAIWSKGIALPTGLHMAINVVLALVGEKDARHALWNLTYTTEVTPLLKEQTETIGIAVQVCILIVAIILTEYYRRNVLQRHKI